MFCTKCGKEIEDTSTFCKFCGAPVGNTAAPSAPVQNAAPQQNSQFATPQFSGGIPMLNLDPKIVDLLNKILRGGIALVGLLAIIGAIGTMGSVGSAMSNPWSAVTALLALYNFMVLLRVAAIIAFILTLGGVGFTILTRQRSLFSYISGVLGLLIFVFHFIMFGMVGAAALGGLIVFSIFEILLSAALIGSSVIILLKKEDIIKFKPKF